MDTAALPMAWDELEQPMAVNVGNPHLVFFVDDARDVPLDALGPRIENDPAFPERINVNVADLCRRPVASCGRASAAPARRWPAGPAPARRAVAAIATKRAESPVTVDMPGGSLTDRLGAGRADPHARRRDPRVRGRARPGGAAVSVETITLGCRLNFAESETIARSAPAGEDWIVVNSCAVTNEAVRQTRQAIRRAHRERPDAQDPRHRLRGRARPRSLRSHAGGRSRRRKRSKLNAFGGK